MYVKIMFLQGDLEEQIYMKKPEGFVVDGKKELVCKLKRLLYGLKQSPRIWYQNFDRYILSFGFERNKVDHHIYSKEEGGNSIYVALYVNDMLTIRNNMDEKKEVKKHLSSIFNMKDIGVANSIFEMEIKRD
jgi:hypothetical protein